MENYKRNIEPATYKGRGLIEMGKEVLEFQSALIYSRAEMNNVIKKTRHFIKSGAFLFVNIKFTFKSTYF